MTSKFAHEKGLSTEVVLYIRYLEYQIEILESEASEERANKDAGDGANANKTTERSDKIDTNSPVYHGRVDEDLNEKNNINEIAKKFYFRCLPLFEKNFLKNPCGDEMFKYWCLSRGNMGIFNVDKFDKEQIRRTIKTCKKCLKKPSIDASVVSDWEIQDEQGHGSNQFIDENKKPRRKFATSYRLAEKMQLVDLYGECLIAKDLHLINAKIQVSEHYAPRADCGSKYNMCVFLISDSFEVVDEFRFEEKFEQWSETHWREAKHLFTVVKPIRYVLFYHSGVDRQFWAGFYGSKMTNGSIRILL